jgi:diguanylate cyclase (GGDEF)-like protein/PAS domain S-box-containing protein
MLFNPEVVAFSSFSTSVVVTGIVTVLFGLFVTVRVQWSRIGWWYLFFAAMVALYAVGVGISYAVTTAELSLFWDRVGHIGVALIPLSFFGTAVEILGCSRRSNTAKRIILAAAVAHLGAIWLTDLVLTGSYRVSWGWYSRYGAVGLLFLAFSGLIMVSVLVLYLREYRVQTDRLDRHRLGFQIAAVCIGFLVAVDVLPALGVDVYPVGYLPVAFFALATGYAILRYRMVDITPELAATTIIGTLSSAVLVTDRRNVIRIANGRAHEVLGWPVPQLVNRNFDEVVRRLAEDAAEVTRTAVPFRDIERTWSLPDGREVILSISASPLTDRAGHTIGTIYVGHDVTRRKRAERELQRLALYDDLTGLPNRKLFFDRFEVMLTTARRDNTLCGLLYVDLNGFKGINDTYGHQSGDTVLRVTAQRIRSTIRDSDTVARIGGDEFVVLCGDLRGPADLPGIVDKIREALQKPVQLELEGALEEVHPGAGIGTAVFPRESTDRDELLRIADGRMYADKRGGGD